MFLFPGRIGPRRAVQAADLISARGACPRAMPDPASLDGFFNQLHHIRAIEHAISILQRPNGVNEKHIPTCGDALLDTAGLGVTAQFREVQHVVDRLDQ